MFKPKQNIKKILRSANCAWLYTDGVVIQEKKRKKVSGVFFDVSVYHVIQCEITVHRSLYSETGHKSNGSTLKNEVGPFRRIVFHYPPILIYGVKNIYIHYNNLSDKMRKQDIHSTSIELNTLSDITINISQFNFLYSNVTVQPNIPTVDPFSANSNVPDTIYYKNNARSKGEVVIWYDENCKKIGRGQGFY